MNWPEKKKVVFGVVAIGLLFLFGFSVQTYFYNKIRDDNYWERASLRQTIILSRFRQSKPHLKKEAGEFKSYARGAIVVSGDKVLFSKNPNESYPIASLSKLMSALIVDDRYSMSREVVFSERAAHKEGGPNFFNKNESFVVRELLFASLIESSNRAVTALAEVIGEKRFVSFMNKKADELGMTGTKFFNPTGLDPDFEYQRANYSTVSDMVKLVKETSKNRTVREASNMRSRSIYDSQWEFHHQAETTNELQVSNLYVAKTGTTPIAGSSLVLMFDNPKDDHILIAIVLGAEDSFSEMRRMLNWTYDSYNF